MAIFTRWLCLTKLSHLMRLKTIQSQCWEGLYYKLYQMLKINLIKWVEVAEGYALWCYARKPPALLLLSLPCGWAAIPSSCCRCSNKKFDSLHWSESCLYNVWASPTRSVNCLNKECFIPNAFCHFRIFYTNTENHLNGF